jgi:hypothetical protein
MQNEETNAKAENEKRTKQVAVRLPPNAYTIKDGVKKELSEIVFEVPEDFDLDDTKKIMNFFRSNMKYEPEM